MANVLSDELRLRVLAALVDGNSIRAVERMTEVHRDTVMRFGVLVGSGAQRLHDRLVRDLSCSLIEVDEQWGYVQKKQSRVDPVKDGPDVGEAWTWAALDSSSRLAIDAGAGRDDATTAPPACGHPPTHPSPGRWARLDSDPDASARPSTAVHVRELRSRVEKVCRDRIEAMEPAQS